MDTKEWIALVSLLEDDDEEVQSEIEKSIMQIGEPIIPYLERFWEQNGFNPTLQSKIENLIHDLQYSTFKNGILNWKNNGAQDLLEGIWWVAKYQFPELEKQHLENQLNQIYFDCWLQMRDEMHPYDIIKVINYILFDKYGFSGNTKNFHSPFNSMINHVLEVKKGNPISLCIIYLLVAQKLKIPIFGVNLPSLFVVQYQSPQISFYINVFNKGIVFGKEDIDTYLKQMNLEKREDFYIPCSNVAIIKRVLLNLMVSYKKNSDMEKMNEINMVYEKL